MKSNMYQSGGKIKKKKKTLNLDYIQKGFEKASSKNYEVADKNYDKALKAETPLGFVGPGYGSLAGGVAGLVTEGAGRLVKDVKNIGTGKGRSPKKFKKQSGGERVPKKYRYRDTDHDIRTYRDDAAKDLGYSSVYAHNQANDPTLPSNHPDNKTSITKKALKAAKRVSKYGKAKSLKKSKLKIKGIEVRETGGFLESPITRLFED